MKLYEVPRKRYVKVIATGEIFYFDHIDGMYSYCKDDQQQVVHLFAGTEVEIVSNKDWYRNRMEKEL